MVLCGKKLVLPIACGALMFMGPSGCVVMDVGAPLNLGLIMLVLLYCYWCIESNRKLEGSKGLKTTNGLKRCL